MNLIFALDSGSISGRHHPFSRSLLTGAFLGCCIFLFTSCNSKKYLKEGESFLFDNKISLKSDHKIDDASELKEKLSLLYHQKQTRTIAGIPRHTLYYRYQERLRRDSIAGRPPRKLWSEEKLIRNRPVIFDSVKTVKTTETFENYLASRGYREADATYRVSTVNKETTVLYKVDPGPRIYLDTLQIRTSDTSLQRLVHASLDETFLVKGAPLDIELYNQEKVRLVNIFQNEGYAAFDETYISALEVDTAGGYVNAVMHVLPREDSLPHIQYYVGDITIYPDYHRADTAFLYDTIIRNVRYVTPVPYLTLKPEAIERNVYLHKGDLTRKDNLLQTVRNLNKMELIRQVQQDAPIDTSNTNNPQVDYTLFLLRNKKILFDINPELTYSSIANQDRSLFGTSVGLQYRDLNVFKGAEVLSLNFEYGIEFNYFSNDDSQISDDPNTNLGAGINLSFPRFMDPLRLYHLIGHKEADEDPATTGNKLRSWLLYDANTRLNLSYNRVNIPALYKYYSTNAGFSYNINPDRYHFLTINRAGIDLFVPTVTSAFRDSILTRSRFMAESFGKYLFTGFILRGWIYEDNSPYKEKGFKLRLDHSFELSGVEAYFFNYVSNLIAEEDFEFVLGNDNPATPESELLRFSHFAKAEINPRFFFNLNSSSQFVVKINPGIAVPFGKYSKQVPYIKQFYVGGAISNRGWQVRELGPGGYRDTLAEKTAFAFYQTGDIKLDMSLEYTFPLFSILEGAVFLDAGNVWLLNRDPARPEAEFKPNTFIDQIAMAYGLGIRLDLDFFVLRADLGYRLRSPYKLPSGSHWYQQRFPGGYIGLDGTVNGPEFQIAVGRPFD